MDVIVKIFFAVLLFLTWFSIIKYRRNVKSWTWNFTWAEHYLWSGWTYLVLLLLWCFLMVWWVLYPFWWLELMFWTNWENYKEFKMK